MGTIYNQRHRKPCHITGLRIKDFAEDISLDAKKYGFTIEQMIKIYHVMAIERSNDLNYDKADAHDEQMKGIADCFDRIADKLSDIANKMDSE